MEVFWDWLAFGTSLKWPEKELAGTLFSLPFGSNVHIKISILVVISTNQICKNSCNLIFSPAVMNYIILYNVRH